MKNSTVPILNPFEMGQIHFDAQLAWQTLFTSTHHFFHINRLEEYKDMMKFPLPPHRKMVFDFVFLTSGTSVRSKGLDSYQFGANTFFFLPAYQITAHKSMSQDAKGFYCHFDSEVLTKNFQSKDLFADYSFLQFIGNPLVTIDEETTQTILFILYRLEKEYKKSDSPDFSIVQGYLLALMSEIKPFVKTEQKVKINAASQITEKYKSALAQYSYQKQKIRDYADILSVTPNHLNKCVKATTGKSAHDLLDDMLLLEAKVMLKQTGLSIAEVAFRIGKTELSDFGRFFKQKTGFTPGEYRKKD
ncbi:AraC family transcriptional regulator [Runella rosea]|uniref:AraC family transcriptional regulator n=1 Tax=Runella rosea TaxID=2259595 RepID=A0A344TP42_9BACT|nr:helix-turn-helix domain-containing protein [Runella rosea]AXE20413.1 AraC family transcriptional regulator [Runella rosea]